MCDHGNPPNVAIKSKPRLFVHMYLFSFHCLVDNRDRSFRWIPETDFPKIHMNQQLSMDARSIVRLTDCTPELALPIAFVTSIKIAQLSITNGSFHSGPIQTLYAYRSEKGITSRLKNGIQINVWFANGIANQKGAQFFATYTIRNKQWGKHQRS